MITLNGTTGITNDGGYTGDGISFADTTPADTLVTTTGGNVGIGTSSPYNPGGYGRVLDVRGSGGSQVLIGATASNASSTALQFDSGSSNFLLSNNKGGGALVFRTSVADDDRTERARIDSSGNLLVGTTSTGTYGGQTAALDVVRTTAGQGAASFKNASSGAQTVSIWNATDSGTRFFIEFSDGTMRATRGSITSNGTTTSYNTSSDYRLKENIQPMQNALARVTALKPVTYKWKSNGSDGEGFIAHELAEVVPDAVVGEKDAVDAEGKPVYQGIDTSFLVATLTAAIQEQQAIITQLQADVAALKGA